jgi:hypothetical protein
MRTVAAEVLKDGLTASNRHALLWMKRVDVLLELHRTQFLPRQPAEAELRLHKAALEIALQSGELLNGGVENAEISLRLGLLTDAYTLFHDDSFSAQNAERTLTEVFPE